MALFGGLGLLGKVLWRAHNGRRYIVLIDKPDGGSTTDGLEGGWDAAVLARGAGNGSS